MGVGNRLWTDAEVQFLRANAHRLKAKDIGVALGRTGRSVSGKSRLLGLDAVKRGKYNWSCTISDEDIELCRQLHDEGIAQNVIADKMEISIQHVNHVVNYRSRLTQTTP